MEIYLPPIFDANLDKLKFEQIRNYILLMNFSTLGS